MNKDEAREGRGVGGMEYGVWGMVTNQRAVARGR